MKTKLLFVLFLLGILSCKDKEPAQDLCSGPINGLKVNQVQMLGSHNSYRIRTYEPIFQMVLSLDSLIPEEYDPNEWDYTHLPIDQQLGDHGMRNFELDIYHDPDGGRYYNRGGNVLILEDAESMIPELQEPGMKVLHIPDVDFETHYPTLRQAFQTIKNWSDQNRNHLPIVIMIEPKTESVLDFIDIDLPAFADVLPFGSGAIDSIDLEVEQVFGSNYENIITPDMVRGEYETLNEAVLNDNWPTIGETRGKIFIVMMGSDANKAAYLEGHPSLQNRPMFIFSTPGNDEAAFIKRDSPENIEEIQELVAQGYMVRTRADANTTEARTGDYSRQEKAFQSGAQIISTDYYVPDFRNDTSAVWTNYKTEFPNKALAIINVINTENIPDCPIQE